MDFTVPTLRLRQWIDSDFEAFAAMNADPVVMEFFPSVLTREDSHASFTRIRNAIDERGWGFWAVEVNGECAGMTGLSVPLFEAHFTPCVEIGWRLRQKFWGRGIATTAARLAERYAFEQLKLEELVTFTATINLRSRRLMERLGFTRDAAGDFIHPRLAVEHPIARHVLYRKSRAEWIATIPPTAMGLR